MRIAEISTPLLRTPPTKYGGTEIVVSLLTEELVRRGHQVTLFASGDSQTKAKLVSIWPKGAFDDRDNLNPEAAHLMLFSKVLERQKEFDLIHNHNGWRFLPLSQFIKVPLVNTPHVPFSSRVQPIFKMFKDGVYASISNSQRKPVPWLNFVSTVYDSIRLEDFIFELNPHDYLLFMGKFHYFKGPVEAIKVAKKLDKNLKIGAWLEPEQEYYFNKEVKPLIDGKLIQYVGEVGGNNKIELIRRAKALLFPINWEEPFGLVMIEAMACGTPVVAFRRGSVPEVVKDGETGFIVPPGDIEGMAQAIKKIYEMPEAEYLKMRQNCRKHVEENFTIEKMVDGYEGVYQKVIEDFQKRR